MNDFIAPLMVILVMLTAQPVDAKKDTSNITIKQQLPDSIKHLVVNSGKDTSSQSITCRPQSSDWKSAMYSGRYYHKATRCACKGSSWRHSLSTGVFKLKVKGTCKSNFKKRIAKKRSQC